MNDTDLLPALMGGPPVRPEGPPDWPFPDDEIAEALQAAYRDGSWGKYHGRYVQLLEERLGEYHALPYVLTCASGTFAVELALRAVKVAPGDEVVLSAYDYPGNFLAVHALGARPVLVDVHPSNWNMNPAALAAALGPQTRAIIASHLHGGIVPMREVMALAEARGVAVVEDAAQAPGALVQGRRAGTSGNAGVLSFGGSKLLTAGRGGALLTRHADLHQRARLQLHRGNNVCPLSELQAAVVRPQLARLDARNFHRAQNVRRLAQALRGVPGLRFFVNAGDDNEPAYYKVGLQFDAAVFGLPRERLIAAVRAEGPAFDDGFKALHVGRSPGRFRKVGDLAEATRAHEGMIVLHHPVLLGSPADIDQVAEAVRKVYANAGRLRDLGNKP